MKNCTRSQKLKMYFYTATVVSSHAELYKLSANKFY